MGIPRFFKLPGHKQFNYEPIYYDERKEKLQERIKQIEAEMGVRHDEQSVRSLGKGSFSDYYARKKKSQKYSNTRLIILIIFLTVVAYYLFFA